jgi:cystathionine gamma-synthase
MPHSANERDDATILARAGIDEDLAYGAVAPPVYLTSNFSFEGFNAPRAHDYTRTSNPTRDMLGRALAEMEGGYHAVITSTGVSAVDLVFQIVPKDGLVIAPFDSYGGTHRLLSARAKQGHYRVTFADMSVGADLEKVFSEKPALVLLETPSNPLMRLTDIAAVAARAKQAGAVVAVDNTFLPLVQKPLALGADVVVYSTSKYINGHGDLIGGAVVSKTKERHDKYAWWANCTGVTGAPFDSFLTLRGLRTLPVRMRQQAASAEAIAQFLKSHPAVKAVYYPGFADHPGHAIAKQQQANMGAMLSFELKGDTNTVRTLLDKLCNKRDSLFTLAVSLGSCESLICHPATMSHASMTPEARSAAGIHDGLLRLSIGLETAEDLTMALKTALDEVK